MKTRIFAAMTGAILVLAACGGGGGEEARQQKVLTLMLEELDPAVDGIWQHSGWELTEENGEVSLFPTTDEGWQDMADSADKVIEVVRKLQTDEYSNGDPEWIAISEGVITFTEEAKQAALAQDEQEVFDLGGDIYRACLACHQRYIIDDE